MKKLNSIEKSNYINGRYKEYLKSSFEFGNSRLQQLFEEQIEKEGLFKGPYVDLNLPFQRGKCVNELIDEGVLSPLFKELGNINFIRPLYSHQEESIRHIAKGRGAIITTGTGSGKTESFLYPILNDILKDIENGNNNSGIRAIFLYPMNALVNDQMDRVRKILENYPNIKFGFFTGDTPQIATPHDREVLGEENGVIIPDNELISREEIRETPPHLLFTNYSMLEYLLIRPSDFSIFDKGRLKNWRYVVLDEAHTYHGSLGIELSLLMRRLTGLAETKPRFILTSATLGEKGKSENEIVDFARNLTSASFEQKDIIFSKRIHLDKSKAKNSVNGNDYVELKKHLENINEVSKIINKYGLYRETSTKEMIYDFLVEDKNVYKLYTILLKGSISFKQLQKKLNNKLDDIELISLIDLINFSEKDNIGLFDLKYHSFVRPLAGAYVTLGNTPELTLTKTNQIGDLKAFEIGNCRFCNTPYIIGRIQRNTNNGLHYLYQNNEIDIYENYGENEYTKIDYFLIKNDISENEIDSELLEEYDVCVKCGEIHSKYNLNALKCECGEEYRVILYKVNQKKEKDIPTAYNNINECPCCGHRSQSGIVKGLNLGKDEGTSIIAQILLEALEEEEDDVQKISSLSLSLTRKSRKEEKTKKVKQFLSFSDSRQQASFSAAFMDSNYTRMLRKRLIWKVIEEQNYQNISLDELASYLTHMIKMKDLFSNRQLSTHKNAWITILIDLLKVDGAYDGEGLGLYYFDLDLSDIENSITDEDVKEQLGKYNLDKDKLLTLMQVVLNLFKVAPAVNYVKSTLTPEEKKEYLEYRRFDNYVMLSCAKSTNGIRSFLPIKGDNMISRYVMKACSCTVDEAVELLSIIFELLEEISEQLGSEGLLCKHEGKVAYQTNASKYILKNYKNNKYYLCSKCGRLTPYNVNFACPQDGCEGTLSEADPDKVLANNYYRNQYKTKKIEKIIIEEHSAQIKRKVAKQFQNDFKNKKINILSCSTTFEMGIDIGDLETVLMRNVPPTPANYVQRAGRAGRRKDSSAYILTYCGTGSHDYTYFNEPEKMISGVIRPPYFNVENKKIIIRHLMAASLGFFFRANPEYFKSINGLVFEGGAEAFNDYLLSKPKDLNEYINEKVLPEQIYKDYHNFKWYDEMNHEDEKMNHFITSIREMVNECEKAMIIASNDQKYTEAEYFKGQIRRLQNLNVIESLSRYCVIPKYGFPIDVVDLQTYENGCLVDENDLSRDLRIAISEYAPDSEVIANKKKYTSKYITLPKTGQFPRKYTCECSKCRRTNIALSKYGLEKCICGNSLLDESKSCYIQPINGFKTGITKESTRMKPKRSYSGEISYIGGGIKDDTKLIINSVLMAESSSNDELLIMNKSGFYVCPECGYSDNNKKYDILPFISREHKNYKQYDCRNDKLELLKLGHEFQTDVVRFTIPILSLMEEDGYAKTLSFLYALLEGISNGLGIERNDIDGIIEINLETNSYDILLFDNVPGGAGHVKRLMNQKAIIMSLESALQKVSQECCDENTSCYNCLRNYYNQSNHSKLRRIYAIEIINQLLSVLS